MNKTFTLFYIQSNDNDSDSLRLNGNDSDSDNEFSSDADHGKSRADISTSTKIFNPTTKKAYEYSNLRKSSAPLVQLRGANPTITPADYEKNSILIYKKPLTKELKEKFGIRKADFKYHYNKADEVMLDFERFLKTFLLK